MGMGASHSIKSIRDGRVKEIEPLLEGIVDNLWDRVFSEGDYSRDVMRKARQVVDQHTLIDLSEKIRLCPQDDGYSEGINDREVIDCISDYIDRSYTLARWLVKR